MNYIKIGCWQPRIVPGLPEFNAEAIHKGILLAEKQGVQILLTPELSISSYTCGDWFLRSDFIEKCMAALEQLIRNTASINMVVIVGLPVRGTNALYNCAAVFSHGKLLGLVPKQYLPNGMGFNERRWFASGCSSQETEIWISNNLIPFGSLIFDLGNRIMLGVEICKDLWEPVPPSSLLALSGANIIVNPSASTESPGRNKARIDAVVSQSSRCYCAYAYCPSLHDESSDEALFGGSSIISECGSLLAVSEAIPLDETLTTSCVDLQMCERRRSCDIGFHESAVRHNKQIRIINSTIAPLNLKYWNLKVPCMPFVPEGEQGQKTLANLVEILTISLCSQMKKTKCSDLIIENSTTSDTLLLVLLLCTIATKQKDSPIECIHLISNKAIPKELEPVANNFRVESSTDITGMHIVDFTLSHASIGRINVTKKPCYALLSGLAQTCVKPLIKYCFELLALDYKASISSSDLSIKDVINDFILYHYVVMGKSMEHVVFLMHKTFPTQSQNLDIEKAVKQFEENFLNAQASRTSMPEGPKVCAFSLSPRGDWMIPTTLKSHLPD